MSPSNIDRYQIGWICALPCEYAAAKAMLDEQHQMISGRHPADSNSYTLGSVHQHNVVIACLPAGVDGTNAAAIAATNLCRTFTSVRLGFMIGIGGGIPSPERDIRLGDVVVSQPHGETGGVIQYDKGKSHDGGRFELKGHLNKPPAVLLTALSSLQAEHLCSDSHLSEYLEAMLQRRPKMRKGGYAHPSTEPDFLHCAHDEDEGIGCCHYCEGGKVKRETRESTEPVIHYGIIASGNQVVKSAAHREEIRKLCGGAICVEMEAAGLMDTFPCLVVRGICDYADSSKNKKWQNYAAATAAAFAKELLLYVLTEQASQTEPIQKILDSFVKRQGQQQQAYNRQQQILRIPSVIRATYGAQGATHRRCHEKTRVDLLHRVKQWATDNHSKPILWLRGQAGTGKSTISWTIAEWLINDSREIDLGASFFFKRGDGDRGSAERFFPTIIQQLVSKIPGLADLVGKAIEAHPFIFGMAIAEQFRRLILKPLLDLPQVQQTQIVVVDALDECESQDDIETILKLWLELPRTNLSLRLFLTSRPELVIRKQFRHMSADIYQDIDLVDAVHKSTIQNDIGVYLYDSLRTIRDDYNDQSQLTSEINDDWPNMDILSQLVSISVPLFIVAVTICGFVKDPRFDPQKRLAKFLENNKTGDMEQMELTYSTVLGYLSEPASDPESLDELRQEFRLVIGSIINLAIPLSSKSLANLLDVQIGFVAHQLAPLHSVLCIPADSNALIQTLHLSFAEFLLSERARSHPFNVDGPSTHLALSDHCLRLLSASLRENICNLAYPGQPRYEIDVETINNELSPAMQYACQYWVYHVQRSKHQLEDHGRVHSFLKEHFLHWLEALSLLDRITDSIGFIAHMRSCVSQNASYLIGFLDDARRFVLKYRQIVDLAPLQLYSSAIIFTPENSLIRQTFPQIPYWIKQYPRATADWGSELLTLEGHTLDVSSIAFSPCSSLLASAGEAIRLWDTQTGRQIQQLDGHSDDFTAVAFSQDGTLLASGLDDGNIWLWDITSDATVLQLAGHTKSVHLVAFSSLDDAVLLSAAYDHTVRQWNTKTGREVKTIDVSSCQLDSLVFSPNGRFFACKLPYGAMHVHDLQTGQVREYYGRTNQWVMSIKFSPDSSQLAYTRETNIGILNTCTGAELTVLEKEDGAIQGCTLAFNHIGSLLAMGSMSGTVRIWDTHTWCELERLDRGPRPISSLCFSRRDSFLASVSCDSIVRLWQIRSKQGVSKPKATFDGVQQYEIAFSPNGVLLASTLCTTPLAFDILCLWNVQHGQEIRKARRHVLKGSCTCFSPDSSLLACGTYDGQVLLFSVATGRELKSIPNAGKLSSIVFVSNTRLAIRFEHGGVHIWDIQTSEVLHRIEDGDIGEGAMAFSAKCSLLAVASGVKVSLYNTLTWQIVTTFRSHCRYPEMRFSPDGSLLAVTTPGCIRVWNVQNSQLTQEFSNISTYHIFDFFDDSTLLTDSGPVEIGERTNHSKPITTISDNWIEHNSQRLLWLPIEYRNAAAVYGTKLAIISLDGPVGFFELDSPTEL